MDARSRQITTYPSLFSFAAKRQQNSVLLPGTTVSINAVARLHPASLIARGGMPRTNIRVSWGSFFPPRQEGSYALLPAD